MSRQDAKTSRSSSWIEILSGVESAIDKTVAEASQREQAVADRPNVNKSECFVRLAKSSERWAGLWARSAEGEKELANAERALATAADALRQHLDALVACRQNLAHWLDRAVG